MNIDREYFKFIASEDGQSIMPANLYTALMSAGWFDLASKMDKTSNELTDEEYGTFVYAGKGNLQFQPIKPVKSIMITVLLLTELEETRIRIAKKINSDIGPMIEQREASKELLHRVEDRVYNLLKEFRLDGMIALPPHKEE